MSDRKCPDGGKCHHACAPSSCFRVGSCGPLSGVFPGDAWPASVKQQFTPLAMKSMEQVAGEFADAIERFVEARIAMATHPHADTGHALDCMNAKTALTDKLTELLVVARGEADAREPDWHPGTSDEDRAG